MILIADSGSTKTAWRQITKDGVLAETKTAGINPYYQSSEEIAQMLEQSLLEQWPDITPKEVYFYGAGCSAPDKKAMVEAALQQAFPASKIEIHHDLEAAARALCGEEPGIACILGTGSNSCLYNGHQIVHNLPNLGFILGDEGSGGYMGKRLVQTFLNNELPADLHQAFQQRYHLTRDEVVDNVYRKPYPNRYMATFAKFLFDHRQHPFIYQMIYQSFSDFFEKTIVKYPDYQQYNVHFVGSIAFHFSDILRKVAQQYAVRVQHILENPMAGLSLYHQQKIA
ncbi:N-acetylglucosamine kinase [Nibribacter ruber]|uniref:N-acetylglucosamine kinase n=1 Tax=Nibribacter ruber TaxID=2698458 RepID=A0A6P1P1T7_9BACT|nr:N-acetylglucosamine kinase [Nibribacter ruber]QHL87792.1 N-acetylglucosamine kinase [Nibribacter ruber]